MRFAASVWLFGTVFALAISVLFVVSGFLVVRAMRRVGQEPLVLPLLTARVGARRAAKAILFVVAIALVFVALARPQYGRGTRLIPATNLDVVIALDYSKSMYARDVAPSRTLRAKTEVSRLIAELPGARFAAVAFAGEPMTFPLTSDGAAIAQFFRQLSPNDMPVGGTSLARALEAGRELLARDPLSKKHAKVIVLVTDGEDLEGDPVTVARSAHDDDVTIHVVQIGGRTPEPIPDVDENGRVVGLRKGNDGTPLTTALSAEGEAQLTEIANATDGRIVRSSTGSTGIEEIARVMSRWVHEELSERVETVYADVYHYPLALGMLLLLIESLIGESRTRTTAILPPQHRLVPRRPSLHKRSLVAAALLGILLPITGVSLPGCKDESKSPFIRHSKVVDEAISSLDAGDAGASVALLENYLSTGKCSGGNIGTPESFEKRKNAALDLGLALFKLAESYGARFGEPSLGGDAGLSPDQQQQLAMRGEQIDCALRVSTAVTALQGAEVSLRARAHYLAGNLRFLREEWKEAVISYDQALRLIPGMPVDAGDPLGNDAAHNRAIALSRMQEKPPPDGGADGGSNDGGPPDAGPPDGGDDKPDAGPPDGGDDKPDGGDDKPDGGNNEPEQPDGGKDDSTKPDAGQNGPDAGAPPAANSSQQNQPPPPTENQDDRVLDMLEQTPTLQEHLAKHGNMGRARLGTEDK